MENVIIIVWLAVIAITIIILLLLYVFLVYKKVINFSGCKLKAIEIYEDYKSGCYQRTKDDTKYPSSGNEENYNNFANRFIRITGVAREDIKEGQMVIIEKGLVSLLAEDILNKSNLTKTSDIDYKSKEKRPKFEPEIETEGKTKYPEKVTYNQFKTVCEYLDNEGLISIFSEDITKTEYERFKNKNYTNE